MKKLLFWLLVFITFLPAVAYFASCFTPYISPVHFGELAFLALGFPYLLGCVLVLTVVWLFVKRKVALLLFVLLLLGFENITATFGFHIFSSAQAAALKPKQSNTLRILGWNVRQFDNPGTYCDSAHAIRRLMFDYLRDTHADVLCMQEFGEHFFKGVLSNTTELIDLGYKYYYAPREITYRYPYGVEYVRTAIFSKVPIIDSGKTVLGDTSYPEHISYVDVLLNNKPLRIYATHFKSINLFIPDGEDPNHNKVSLYGDTVLVYHTSKLNKLKRFAQAHAKEALLAKDALNKSAYPFVFSGDLNSVPTSFPYHHLSRGLQDAFLQNGFGFGTTLDSLPKSLRIDFLLADKRVAIKYYHKDINHLSDHYPQIIDVAWKEQ